VTGPGPRIGRFTPEVRDEAQQRLFDTLVGGPRGPGIIQDDGALFGPFNAFMLDPTIGDRVQALGLAVQSADALPPAMREAVILSVAGRRSCRGEWEAHRPRALAAGLTEADVQAIATGHLPGVADEEIRTALALAGAQMDHRPLDDAAYRGAVDVLGERRVFEVWALVGYYDALCGLFTLFRLDD